jgi:hypothetical protein
MRIFLWLLISMMKISIIKIDKINQFHKKVHLILKFETLHKIRKSEKVIKVKEINNQVLVLVLILVKHLKVIFLMDKKLKLLIRFWMNQRNNLDLIHNLKRSLLIILKLNKRRNKIVNKDITIYFWLRIHLRSRIKSWITAVIIHLGGWMRIRSEVG